MPEQNQVENVVVQMLDKALGPRLFKIAVGSDERDGADFEGQRSDRFLFVSHLEFEALVAAVNGMKRKLERGRLDSRVEKIDQLTTEDIVRTAKTFRWGRSMPKWTVIVSGAELPARPLVLEAAGAPPNDSTNSHRAVAILKSLGFDTRYEGRSV